MGRPSTSPIILDESAAVIVITCTDHPWWSACRFLHDDAYDAACRHEERDHPTDTRQRDAAMKRHARRVANPSKAVLSGISGA